MKLVFDSRCATSASATEWSFIRPALTTSNDEHFECRVEWVSVPHSWYLINETNDSYWISNEYTQLQAEVLDYYLAHYLQFVPTGQTWDTTRPEEEQVRAFEVLARSTVLPAGTPTLHEHFTALGLTSVRKVVLNHGSYDAWGLARELQRAHAAMNQRSAEDASLLWNYVYQPHNSTFKFVDEILDLHGFVFTDRSPLDCLGLDEGLQSGQWVSSRFAHFLPVTSVDVMLCNYSLGGQLSTNTLHTVQVNAGFGSLITAGGGEWLALSERVVHEFRFCFTAAARGARVKKLDFNGVPWTLCLSVRKISPMSITHTPQHNVRESHRPLPRRRRQESERRNGVDEKTTQSRR